MKPQSTDQDKIWDFFQNEGLDAFADSEGRLDYIAKQIRAGERVLNIGVGAGVFEQMAVERGIKISSLDPNPRAINILRERLQLGDEAKVGYSNELPFEDDRFDVVVMSEVIEHLEDGVLERTLEEVSRVLVRGGRLIGTVPARENLSEQTVVCPDCGKIFHRWGHRQSFNCERARRLLEKYLRVDKVVEKTFVTWRGRNMRRLLTGAVRLALFKSRLYTQNANIFFVATKMVQPGGLIWKR